MVLLIPEHYSRGLLLLQVLGVLRAAAAVLQPREVGLAGAPADGEKTPATSAEFYRGAAGADFLRLLVHVVAPEWLPCIPPEERYVYTHVWKATIDPSAGALLRLLTSMLACLVD